MKTCLICRKPIFNYTPKYCCDGKDCSCKGLPLNPCVCSKRCEKAVFGKIGIPYEDRRIMYNIPIWRNKMTKSTVSRLMERLSNFWRKRMKKDPKNGDTLSFCGRLYSFFNGIWIDSELYNHPKVYGD